MTDERARHEAAALLTRHMHTRETQEGTQSGIVHGADPADLPDPHTHPFPAATLDPQTGAITATTMTSGTLTTIDSADSTHSADPSKGWDTLQPRGIGLAHLDLETGHLTVYEDRLRPMLLTLVARHGPHLPEITGVTVGRYPHYSHDEINGVALAQVDRPVIAQHLVPGVVPDPQTLPASLTETGLQRPPDPTKTTRVSKAGKQKKKPASVWATSTTATGRASSAPCCSTHAVASTTAAPMPLCSVGASTATGPRRPGSSSVRAGCAEPPDWDTGRAAAPRTTECCSLTAPVV